MFTLVMTLSVLLGVVAHWAVSFGRKKLDCSLKDYFMSEVPHTIATLGGAIAAVAANVYLHPDMQITQVAVALAITSGFTIDSSFNKPPSPQ